MSLLLMGLQNPLPITAHLTKVRVADLITACPGAVGWASEDALPTGRVAEVVTTNSRAALHTQEKMRGTNLLSYIALADQAIQTYHRAALSGQRRKAGAIRMANGATGWRWGGIEASWVSTVDTGTNIRGRKARIKKQAVAECPIEISDYSRVPGYLQQGISQLAFIPFTLTVRCNHYQFHQSTWRLSQQ